MPTEMELTLEQTQQGVSHEVSVNPHGFEANVKMVVDVPDPAGSHDPYTQAHSPTTNIKSSCTAQVTCFKTSATLDTHTSFSSVKVLKLKKFPRNIQH
ncbi:hypothetical protein Tco_1514925 [Tanacetum coccineum]